MLAANVYDVVWFVVLLLVALLVVAAVVAVVLGGVRRVARERAAMSPAPVADRLAQVEELHAAGTISASERDGTRARILGTL